MQKTNIPWNPKFYQFFSWFLDIYPQPVFNQENWPDIDAYNRYAKTFGVSNQNQDVIEFIPQTHKSKTFNQQYEPLIYQQGHVLTRDKNWHDFFNMLVWCRFPKTKALINSQQYLNLKYRVENNRPERTPQENALTIFDENGIIIISPQKDLLEDIQNHAWQRLFIEKRAQLTQLRVMLFGHALYEKLLNPYIGLCGHSLLFNASLDSDIDSLIQTFLTEQTINRQHLNPFPLLGMPGAHPDNENESFYDNKAYFRES